ncbi:MAG: hypothetical protein ABIR56_18820 [Polaromonas sp.]
MTRSQLQELVESRISDISHVVLAHPRMAADLPRISEALLGMGARRGTRTCLRRSGCPAALSR